MISETFHAPRRFVAAGAVLSVASLGAVLHSAVRFPASVGPGSLLPLIVALVFVNLLVIRLPRGDVVVLDAAMVVGALLVYGGAAAVIISCIGGLIGSVLVRTPSESRIYSMLDFMRRVLAAWTVGYAGAALLPDGAPIVGVSSILAALLTGLLYMSLDLGTHGVMQAVRERSSVLVSMESVARPIFFLYLGQVCLGVVLAVVYPDVGALAVVVLGVLAMILINAFNMYLKTTIMYQQTIDALSRASSLQVDAAGHNARLVADLCVSVARRLGMQGRVLEKLSYAALLSDLGHLGLHDDGAQDDGHEEAGAELVSSVPFLACTAEMIRNHHTPFSELGTLDADDALGAATIHLCSDFVETALRESLLCSVEGRLTAFQMTSQGAEAQYSARVISALARELKDRHSVDRFDWGVGSA